MKALSFNADGELYAVDAALVDKVMRNDEFTPVLTAPAAVVGIANMRGGIITLLSLSELLGRTKNEKAAHSIVFQTLKNSNDKMALLIDTLGDLITINDEDIVQPCISDIGAEASFISGLAEIGEKLYKIISVEQIAKSLSRPPVGAIVNRP